MRLRTTKFLNPEPLSGTAYQAAGLPDWPTLAHFFSFFYFNMSSQEKTGEFPAEIKSLRKQNFIYLFFILLFLMDSKNDLTILLRKHDEKTITPEERDQLHGLLSEIYSPGQKMFLYRCPDCKKPLFNMHHEGPQCMYSQGGCGYKP